MEKWPHERERQNAKRNPGRSQKPQETLPHPARGIKTTSRSRPSRRRRDLQHLQRRNLRVSRRKRLRQIDHRADNPPVTGADRRASELRRARADRPQPERNAESAAAHANDLPRPVRLTEPEDERRQHHRRAVNHPQHRQQQQPERADPGAAESSGTQPLLHQPVSARIQRRAAAADRDSPRPGHQPRFHRSRRTHLRFRRFHPGPGGQLNGRPERRVRVNVFIHRPRPVDGAVHQRPGGGDVLRADCGVEQPERSVRPSAASVHPGFIIGDTDTGPGERGQAAAVDIRGRCAESGQSPEWLPVPSAVQLHDRDMQGGGPGVQEFGV